MSRRKRAGRASAGERIPAIADSPYQPHIRFRQIAAVVAAIPELSLAGAFLLTWIAPTILGPEAIAGLMLLMLFEFLSVHSSAFTGNILASTVPRTLKAVALIGLGLFYSIFAGIFAILFSAWWPLLALWGLTAEKLIFVFLGRLPNEEQQQTLRTDWAIGVFLYVALAAGTTFVPIPPLGITEEVWAAEGLGISGLWMDEPHRVIAFGFLYFALSALASVWTRATGRSLVP